MWTEPRERFSRLVVSILHDAIMSSRPGAPIRLAFDGLGDHFCEVSTAIVSRQANADLSRLGSLGLSPRDPLPPIFVSAASDIVHRALLELIRTWENRRYTLDGEPVDLEMFLRVNRGVLTAEDVREIRSMRFGDRMVFGGGAGATSVLECAVTAPESERAA